MKNNARVSIYFVDKLVVTEMDIFPLTHFKGKFNFKFCWIGFIIIIIIIIINHNIQQAAKKSREGALYPSIQSVQDKLTDEEKQTPKRLSFALSSPPPLWLSPSLSVFVAIIAIYIKATTAITTTTTVAMDKRWEKRRKERQQQCNLAFVYFWPAKQTNYVTSFNCSLFVSKAMIGPTRNRHYTCIEREMERWSPFHKSSNDNNEKKSEDEDGQHI